MGLVIDSVEGGGKQHHISCGEYYNKFFTNIIWLYVNSCLITGSEVRVLGLGMLGWGVDGGFYVKDLTENNLNMT